MLSGEKRGRPEVWESSPGAPRGPHWDPSPGRLSPVTQDKEDESSQCEEKSLFIS